MARLSVNGPLGRLRLTEQVEASITRLITEARWPAGTVLPPEADLAVRFGVSRTVIRECVRVLASRGMLDVKQGRGTIVNDLSAWRVVEPLASFVKADTHSLLDWLEVRMILEMGSAALAARRCTQEDRVLLEEALRRTEESGTDPDATMEADIALHLAIAQTTHNPALLRILEPVVQPLREQLQATALLPRARRLAVREHCALVEGILAADSERARHAMSAHLTRVAEEISELLADS